MTVPSVAVAVSAFFYMWNFKQFLLFYCQYYIFHGQILAHTIVTIRCFPAHIALSAYFMFSLTGQIIDDDDDDDDDWRGHRWAGTCHPTSANQSISQSINQSINQSISQSINGLLCFAVQEHYWTNWTIYEHKTM